MQKSVFHSAPGGCPANPSHCITLLCPSLCHNHLLLSPAMKSFSWAPLLQMDVCSSSHEGKSPKNHLGVFSEAKQHGQLQTELLSRTSWKLKGRLHHQNFFPWDYCSALITKTCLIAHRVAHRSCGVVLTQDIMLVLPMEKNITTVKVENGSSYKCIFEINIGAY